MLHHQRLTSVAPPTAPPMQQRGSKKSWASNKLLLRRSLLTTALLGWHKAVLWRGARTRSSGVVTPRTPPGRRHQGLLRRKARNGASGALPPPAPPRHRNKGLLHCGTTRGSPGTSPPAAPLGRCAIGLLWGSATGGLQGQQHQHLLRGGVSAVQHSSYQAGKNRLEIQYVIRRITNSPAENTRCTVGYKIQPDAHHTDEAGNTRCNSRNTKPCKTKTIHTAPNITQARACNTQYIHDYAAHTIWNMEHKANYHMLHQVHLPPQPIPDKAHCTGHVRHTEGARQSNTPNPTPYRTANAMTQP